MKNKFIIALFCTVIHQITAQQFTRKDSLQGGFSKERMCYDVLHYKLDIKVDPSEKYISGSNSITFKVVEKTSSIQVDLFENMQVDSIIFNQNKLKYSREFGAVFIQFEDVLDQDLTQHSIQFYYSGNPIIAQNAPWDGGFVFSKDANNNDFIGVAVQGTGSSLWFPAKDSQSDEPDFGATIKVAVPNGLMNVSNGKLMGNEDLKNGYTRWDWKVVNPINHYNITLNIGDYVEIKDRLNDLPISYFVLKNHQEIAAQHFTEVKPMLQCFESKFGPYPFFEDGFKLVETPYLGMEHQSAVAYGNKFKKGYLGRDISETGVGLLFDFITIHESAHEWFGNSVTSRDIADMWIHEAFTTYAESVFIECEFGYEKSQQYINGSGNNISHKKPIIGQFGVNAKGDSDMYYKGALMLNTLRNIVNNDVIWWKTLKEFAIAFRHSIIESKDVIAFFNAKTHTNLTPIFNQYLKHTNLPEIELRKHNNRIQARWIVNVPHFEMPIEYEVNGKIYRQNIDSKWQKLQVNQEVFDEIKLNRTKFFIK